MKNKFMKRGSCLILAGLFAVSMTACGKPSAKKLSTAAEKKIEAKEITLEELEDKDNSEKNQKALKKGLFLDTTGEEIEDVFEDELKDFDLEEIGEAYDIDLDGWEVEDFKNISIYAKADTDKFNTTYKDIDIQYVAVIEFEDKKQSDELFEELMDKFEDLANDADIDLEDLSKDEYLNKGNKGHLIINLEASTVVDALFDELEEEKGESIDKDIVKEYKKSVGDLRIVIGIYYEGGVLTTIIGISEDDMEDISTLAKSIGVKDPLTIESSDELAKGILTLYTSGFTNYLSKAQDAAQQIQDHNAEVEAVVDEINEALEG